MMHKEKSKHPHIRFKKFNKEWEDRKLEDFSDRYKDMVPTPANGYYRLGVRSHGKGTFSTYVPPGEQIAEKNLCRVKSGALIVNIVFAWEKAVTITDAADEKALVSHRFPQFVLHDDVIPSFFKYCILDEKFRRHLELSSPSGAGRNRTLNLKDMLEYNFILPESDEQLQISSILNYLDDAIVLCQREYDRIVNLRRSMLEKMFPRNGSDCPEIRFKGFTDAWEQRKFDDLFIENNERNENMYGVERTISISSMSFKPTGNGADESSLTFYKVLRVGDIAFEGHTNDKFAYGRFVMNDIGNGIMSPRFTTLRPKSILIVDFWKYYIHYEPIMRTVLIRSTKAGRMMNELVVKDLMKNSLFVPVENEQKMIGALFVQIDNLITLHQRKLEKLQNMKKSLLEKMFPH